jgi:hypothetical protein
VFLLLAASGIAFGQPTHRDGLSICEVRSQPQKYLGKIITVTGEAFREHHGTHLGSPKCDLGALLVPSPALRRSKRKEDVTFQEGLYQTYACLDNRPFVVTVRGRFGTVKSRGMVLYRIVAERAIATQFTEGLSHFCTHRDVPPPNIKTAPQPLPDLVLGSQKSQRQSYVMVNPDTMNYLVADGVQ